MAKQTGPLFITGTYNGICFYKLHGKHYARKQSSLTGKRVKKDPAFTLTMVYAGLLGQASAIAGEVYRLLPAGKRKVALYRAMTSRANGWLKAGMAAEEVKERLMAEYSHEETTHTPPTHTRSITQHPHTPAKSLRILSTRPAKRPLLRNRNGTLHVSTQGLLASTEKNGITTLRTRRQNQPAPKERPLANQ